METDFDTEEEESQPKKEVTNRDLTTGKWKKGFSGNLAGRPRGKTMKEYAREYLSKLSDAERDEWLEGLDKDTIWKMAEGAPSTKMDLTSNGQTIGSAKDLTDEELEKLANGNTDTTTGSEGGTGEEGVVEETSV